MSTWWTNASLKEKQLTLLGAVLLIIFLLYEITLAPLSNHVAHMRKLIASEQELLTWMESTNLRIKQLASNTSKRELNTTASLLNLIQTELEKSYLSKNITSLQQVDNESIELRLQHVSFDSLMKWLINISQTSTLIVLQASIIPSNTPGIVEATFKFT